MTLNFLLSFRSTSRCKNPRPGFLAPQDGCREVAQEMLQATQLGLSSRGPIVDGSEIQQTSKG